MRSATRAATAIVILALSGPGGAQSPARVRADVSCRPGPEKLHYDCVIRLADSRTGEPRSGLTLTVGADMPSMPAAHQVRPVTAAEDRGTGTYRARIVLEMYGDWALRLDVSGAVRDRVVKLLRFESDRADEPPPAPAPGHHRR